METPLTYSVLLDTSRLMYRAFFALPTTIVDATSLVRCTQTQWGHGTRSCCFPCGRMRAVADRVRHDAMNQYGFIPTEGVSAEMACGWRM